MKISSELSIERAVYRAVPYVAVQVVRRHPAIALSVFVVGAVIEFKRFKSKQDSLLVRVIS